MYLKDTLKVSDYCNDFYRGFDALKKSIFIGDVYVAVALRGLRCSEKKNSPSSDENIFCLALV